MRRLTNIILVSILIICNMNVYSQSVDVIYNDGVNLFFSGECNLANEKFDKVIKINPDNINAYLAKAIVFRYLNQFELSKNYLRLYLARAILDSSNIVEDENDLPFDSPRFPFNYQTIIQTSPGKCYFINNWFGDTLDTDGLRDRGILYCYMGEYDKSEECFHQLNSISETPFKLYYLFKLSLLKKDTISAHKFLFKFYTNRILYDLEYLNCNKLCEDEKSPSLVKINFINCNLNLLGKYIKNNISIRSDEFLIYNYLNNMMTSYNYLSNDSIQIISHYSRFDGDHYYDSLNKQISSVDTIISKLKHDDELYSLYIIIGGILNRLGREKQSLFYFNKALGKGNDSIVYYCIGKANYDSKDYQLAIRNFDSSIMIGGHNPNTYYFKGMSLLELGKKNEALNCFLTSIEIDSFYLNAYKQCSNIYISQFDFKKSYFHYKRSVKINNLGLIHDIEANTINSVVYFICEYYRVIGLIVLIICMSLVRMIYLIPDRYLKLYDTINYLVFVILVLQIIFQTLS